METDLLSLVLGKATGSKFLPFRHDKTGVETINLKDKNSPYSLIRRDLQNFASIHLLAEKVKKASDLLMKASGLAEDKGLKNYLALRAQALLTDDYYNSDLAWMDMKNNTIDLLSARLKIMKMPCLA